MFLDSNNQQGSDSNLLAGQESWKAFQDRLKNRQNDSYQSVNSGQSINSLTDDDSYQSLNSGRSVSLTDEDAYQSMNAGSKLELDDNDSYQSNNAYQDAQLGDEDSYQSMNPTPSSQLEDSGYESANRENFSDPEFQDYYRDSQRGGVMDQAKRAAKRAQARVQKTLPKTIGEKFLGDKHAFKEDTPENRERVKELAKERARNAVSKELGKKITNETFKKGFEKGLSKGAGQLAKAGAKKAGKAASEAAIKAGTKVAGQAATKGLQAAVTAGGAATGIETLGLGFLAAFLLNIAIDLGVSDAVDCVFELGKGNIKQATFHAQKAYMSIGMFIWLLIGLIFTFSAAGFIIGVPIMLGLTIYMLLGVAFPGIGLLQGLSRWWEKGIIILIDFFLFIIMAAFIGGIVYYVCDQAGYLDGSPTVTSVVLAVTDWWNGTEWASMVETMCKPIKNLK